MSVSMLALLLLALPSLSAYQKPFDYDNEIRSRKGKRRHHHEFGLKDPVLYSTKMVHDQDIGRNKSVFRVSPNDQKEIYISYVVEGKTFRMVHLEDKGASYYSRQIANESYLGFRDMVTLSNGMTVLVLQTNMLRYHTVFLDQNMTFRHEYPLMVPSGVQNYKDTVLMKTSDQDLMEYMPDLSKRKAQVTLPGGSIDIIPQVVRLLDKYGVFFFDKDHHLLVSIFQELSDLPSVTPQTIETFYPSTQQRPLCFKVTSTKDKVFVAVLRKDGQVELSSFNMNPDNLEMSFDNQHIKAMKVDNPLETTLDMTQIRGTLLVVTSSQNVQAMAFDFDLEQEMEQTMLCQQMDCLDGPNDRMQVSIDNQQITLRCLQRDNTDIILNKVYYYKDLDKKHKNPVGRIFIVLFIMIVFGLLIFYAYKEYRKRKKTHIQVVRPEQNNNEQYQIQQLSSNSMISIIPPPPDQEQFNPEKQQAFNQYDQSPPPLTLGLADQPHVLTQEQESSSLDE